MTHLKYFSLKTHRNTLGALESWPKYFQEPDNCPNNVYNISEEKIVLFIALHLSDTNIDI